MFLAGGVRELRDRLTGMMTLISLAIGVAFVFSLAVTFGYPGDALWWELATLVTIMLLGHWIDMRSIVQARGALRELHRQRAESQRRCSRPAHEELLALHDGANTPAAAGVRGGVDVREHGDCRHQRTVAAAGETVDVGPRGATPPRDTRNFSRLA